MELALAVILGSFFGFALYYVGATNSKKIKAMLSLTDMSLAKIIFMAIGIGSIVVALLNIFNLFDPSHFSIKKMNLGVIVGGIIFGIGFALIGSCPGTLLAGLFTNIKRNLVAIIGGLVGAFTFTLMYPYFKSIKMFDILNINQLTLFKITNVDSLFPIGFIGLLIFGIILVLIGYFLPKHILKNRD